MFGSPLSVACSSERRLKGSRPTPTALAARRTAADLHRVQRRFQPPRRFLHRQPARLAPWRWPAPSSARRNKTPCATPTSSSRLVSARPRHQARAQAVAPGTAFVGVGRGRTRASMPACPGVSREHTPPIIREPVVGRDAKRSVSAQPARRSGGARTSAAPSMAASCAAVAAIHGLHFTAAAMRGLGSPGWARTVRPEFPQAAPAVRARSRPARGADAMDGQGWPSLAAPESPWMRAALGSAAAKPRVTE